LIPINAEWKEQVLEKLGKVNELVIQVQRIADALERIGGIRLKTLEDDIISWLESGGEETKVVDRIDKGKQREQSLDGTEEEGEVKEQEEKDAMEGVEEGSGGLSLVVYSVGTVAK